MARIAVVSFRLGGGDGVSIEAAKWVVAVESLGHTVRTVAGEGTADVIMPGLALHASRPPTAGELHEALDDVDLVIVENLLSLPLNLGARDVVSDVLRGRPTVLHHHDLPWQRDHLAHLAGPSDDPAWCHVTINEYSRRELAERGIEADVVRNRFDCDPPLGDRHGTRTQLAIGTEPLVLFPMRAIARKNVAGALRLAERLDATFWLVGPAEDGYGDQLDRLLQHASVTIIRGMPEGRTIHDAYAACDLVVMASTWEGFGNPVLESVTHRRPLALNPYPVALELLEFGFSFARLDDIEHLRRELVCPDLALREANLDVARQHFALSDLPAELRAVFARHFPALDL